MPRVRDGVCRVCNEAVPIDRACEMHPKLGAAHLTCAPLARVKKPRLKLSPELVDGDHWTPVDTVEEMIEAIRQWYGDLGQDVGEGFQVEVVAMSDDEIAVLPDC